MAWWWAASPISRLAQRLNGDSRHLYANEEGVAREALFLADTHPMIEAVLSDAEEREIRDTSVKSWLCELKYIAADIEDVLEEYEYYIYKDMVEGEASSAGHHKIKDKDRKKKHIQETFLNELSERIQKIRKRFDEINVKRKALKSKKDDEDRYLKTPAENQVRNRNVANEVIMYGRDDVQKYLVDHLKNEYNHVVIHLVGVGGVGKTTLAQALYNDVEIDKHFDCKVWVTVSEAFDVTRITKEVLETFTKVASNLTQLSVIQEKLADQLQGKKFFLVLDDVWEEKWYKLGFLLQMASIGSKILITTRIKRVTNAMLPSKVFILEPLLEQDGWELFCKHAFGSEDEGRMVPDLLMIGKEIAKRCKGIPLLLKVLGDNLREAGTNKKRWGEILNHKTWEINDDSGNSNVMEILKLSFDRLPKKLKHCFLFCSLFPKDYKFEMDELARLWAAHGLIETKGSRQVEDIGKECVRGLFRRSFIEPHESKLAWYMRRSSVGFIRPDVTFSLHDLMHDLGQHIICSEQSLTKDCANTIELHHTLMAKTSQTLRCCYEPIIGRNFLQSWYPSKQVPTVDMLAHHLKRLRVLILEDQFLEAISDSIGDLKHLRYLCLHTPLLGRLPNSVCLLYNLQTLECPNLQELPQDMRRLKRLQHLLVGRAKLPPRISELVELQTLRQFHVLKGGDDECAHLSELRHLRHLGGKFKISGLNNADAEEAKLSNLSNKPNLQSLVLEWDIVNKDDYCKQSMLVLGNLKPHNYLEELMIFHYPGTQLPEWMGSLSFLTKVNLYYCSKCVTLPAFGQLSSLTELCLEEMHCLERIGRELYGTSPLVAFPSLKYLELSCMNSLREWWGMDECSFQRLNTLVLVKCPSLRFPVSDMNVKRQASLTYMFSTVLWMEVDECPHVEEWCKANAFTTLAGVRNMWVNGQEFR